MATIRQKKLANAVVENLKAAKPLNKQELVASVGYSDASADKKATEILESKGTQEELKILGFDEASAKKVVADILLNEEVEPQHRLKAASEVFKVSGAYAPERHDVTTKGDKITDDEALKEAAKLYGATVAKRKVG